MIKLSERPDCGSNSCYYVRRPAGGQRNNGRCRCHPVEVMRYIERLETRLEGVWEEAAQIVERHGSHPVKPGDKYSPWIATPFYEKSKEIANELRQRTQHEREAAR